MPFVLRRHAARVVLLDAAQRVFLIRSVDPADPTKPAWWETPGGGIDPGEAPEDACRRELWEEAGIRGAEIGPCVWVQRSEFDFGGFHFDQHERIHVAHLAGEGEPFDPQALESLEALAFTGGRWWELDDLLTSEEPTVPVRLREHLPDLVAGRLPAEPIDITPG